MESLEKIKERIGFLAEIAVYPGEDEMAAMAMNANMMLKGELLVKKYPH